MGRGPARPTNIKKYRCWPAARPGVHHIFICSRPNPARPIPFFIFFVPARPGSSDFEDSRPGPARPTSHFPNRPSPHYRHLFFFRMVARFFPALKIPSWWAVPVIWRFTAVVWKYRLPPKCYRRKTKNRLVPKPYRRIPLPMKNHRHVLVLPLRP